MSHLNARIATANKILQLTESNSEIYPELFWMDQRPHGGWRLSDMGEKFFYQANISSTTVKMWDLDNRIKTYRTAVDAKTLLDLDKYVKSPYYIEFISGRFKRYHIQVKLYDERIGTMMLLYGSVSEYLKSVKGVNND